jgi:hypothetical protein
VEAEEDGGGERGNACDELAIARRIAGRGAITLCGASPFSQTLRSRRWVGAEGWRGLVGGAAAQKGPGSTQRPVSPPKTRTPPAKPPAPLSSRAEVTPLVGLVALCCVWATYKSVEAFGSPNVFLFRGSNGVYGEEEAAKGEAWRKRMQSSQDGLFDPAAKAMYGFESGRTDRWAADRS